MGQCGPCSKNPMCVISFSTSFSSMRTPTEHPQSNQMIHICKWSTRIRLLLHIFSSCIQLQYRFKHHYHHFEFRFPQNHTDRPIAPDTEVGPRSRRQPATWGPHCVIPCGRRAWPPASKRRRHRDEATGRKKLELWALWAVDISMPQMHGGFD